MIIDWHPSVLFYDYSLQACIAHTQRCPTVRWANP